MSQKNFTNATGNWTVGSDDHINYSSSAKLEGTIQATDFLDADGNSIITQALNAAGTFVTKDVSNRVDYRFKIDNSDESFVVSQAKIKASQFELPPPTAGRIDSKLSTGKFYIGERRESPSNADRTQLEIGHTDNALLKLDNVYNWVKLEQGHLIFSRMSMQKTTSEGGNANDSVGFVWDQNKVVNIDWKGIVTANGFALPDPPTWNVSNFIKFGKFSVGEKWQGSSYPDRRVLVFSSGDHNDEMLSMNSYSNIVSINKGKLGISRMSLQKTTSDGGFADDALGIMWDNGRKVYIDWQGNAVFNGTVKVNGTRPLSTRSDLINTLSTLSDAIRDESTVEGMREAIRNAITGLIGQLEADQT